jgi:hypothetical protein
MLKKTLNIKQLTFYFLIIVFCIFLKANGVYPVANAIGVIS